MKRFIFLIAIFFTMVPSSWGEDTSETHPSLDLQTQVDGVSESLPAKKKGGMSFLPVPFVFSDPNEGQTFGLKFALFFKDAGTNQVNMILAPKIAYNTLIKTVGGATFLKYFSLQENLTVTFGIGQEVYRQVLADYENRRAGGGKFYLRGSFQYIRDPFGRFWGIGNNTPESNQSDYVGPSFYGDGEFGYYFLPNFRIGLRESWNTSQIDDGIISSLPSTNAVFGPADGVVDSSNLINKVALTYDSRPLEDVSNTGFYSDVYFLWSNKDFGSDVNFTGFGFDVRKLWSFRNERFTTVVRGNFQKLFGDDIPFYLQSSLGGANELRAFPKNRFIDEGKMLFSAEERIRIGTLHIMKTEYQMSVASFFEVGEVFHDFSDVSWKYLQPVGGLGVRIKIPPLTVIRADAGFGREGIAFFVTSGYPF